MQNLLLSSGCRNLKVWGRLFATIKNLKAELSPTDTLVHKFFILSLIDISALMPNKLKQC